MRIVADETLMIRGSFDRRSMVSRTIAIKGLEFSKLIVSQDSEANIILKLSSYV